MKNKTLLYTILGLIVISGVVYAFTTKNKNLNTIEGLEKAQIKNEDENIEKENVNIKEEIKTNSELGQITLENKSSGLLKIERTFDYQESHNTSAKLTFTPSDSNKISLVSVMPPGVSGLENVIIFDNKIYFISEDEKPSLKYFDITDSKFKVANENIGAEGYISSFVPINNEIYYISGSKQFGFCLNLPKDKCLIANLYKYNFEKDKIELLAKDIKGSNILGIDKIGNLYFSLAWGDAGAWFAKIYKYKDGQVEFHKEYTDASQIDEYEKFISSLDTMQGYQSIILENGKLSPGPDISENSKNKYFFFN